MSLRVQLLRPDGIPVDVDLPAIDYSVQLAITWNGQALPPQVLIAQLALERDYWKAKAEEYGGKLADLAARESGGG